MRIFVVALLWSGVPLLAQSVPASQAALPKAPAVSDARSVLAAAAPFYDFNEASIRPWHLRASYTLYTRDGTPEKQGTFEYWWASATLRRSTWTRPGAIHTDWYSNGMQAHQTEGERPGYFESRLESALLAPLPGLSGFDPDRVQFDREVMSAGNGLRLRCISAIPRKDARSSGKPRLGEHPTWCFDPKLPVLRVSYSPDGLATEYNQIAVVQNRYLAREVLIFDGQRKVLSMEVLSITGLDASDAALHGPDQGSPASAEKLAEMHNTPASEPVPIDPH